MSLLMPSTITTAETPRALARPRNPRARMRLAVMIERRNRWFGAGDSAALVKELVDIARQSLSGDSADDPMQLSLAADASLNQSQVRRARRQHLNAIHECRSIYGNHHLRTLVLKLAFAAAMVEIGTLKSAARLAQHVAAHLPAVVDANHELLTATQWLLERLVQPCNPVDRARRASDQAATRLICA